MKKLTSALVIASALLVGAAAPSSAAEPPRNCQGQLVSFAVRLFDGRREVASAFFGDYPQAVHDAERFARTVCEF